MRIQILAASLLLVNLTAKAQMSLEHTYASKTAGVATIEDEGQIYYTADNNNTVIELYHDNHALWKTLAMPIPGNATLLNIYYISKKLFDTDNDIEFAYTYITGTPVTYTTIIANENGTALNTLADASFMAVKNVNGAWKALVQYYSSNQTEVYSLPGTYVGILPTQKSEATADALLYPNPMGNAATLSYTLPAGTHTGTIEVLNMAGQRVRTYTVTNTFNDILVQRGELPAGTYTYTLHAAGATPVQSKFVIQ